jgi:hypothetical protein
MKPHLRLCQSQANAQLGHYLCLTNRYQFHSFAQLNLAFNGFYHFWRAFRPQRNQLSQVATMKCLTTLSLHRQIPTLPLSSTSLLFYSAQPVFSLMLSEPNGVSIFRSQPSIPWPSLESQCQFHQYYDPSTRCFRYSTVQQVFFWIHHTLSHASRNMMQLLSHQWSIK